MIEISKDREDDKGMGILDDHLDLVVLILAK
jgi:hypothetical protein